jgi:hypothetical protein
MQVSACFELTPCLSTEIYCQFNYKIILLKQPKYCVLDRSMGITYSLTIQNYSGEYLRINVHFDGKCDRQI